MCDRKKIGTIAIIVSAIAALAVGACAVIKCAKSDETDTLDDLLDEE